MLILALETSCDETAAAIVEDGTLVRSNVIASSRAAFERSGGVVPEIAARRQVECILPVIDQCLEEAGVIPKQIDALAVTKGPGLLGSLIVGTTTARVIARVWQKPLIGVHHTLGHLSSTWLEQGTRDQGQETVNDLTNHSCHMSRVTCHFPILTLSASGGHTDLWYRQSHLRGTLLGQTRDDAAGEAFDKGASVLSLPYPGGPSISKAAEQGRRDAFAFPHPFYKEDTLDFSFSGLKTALKYLLRDFPIANSQLPIADVAASYEHALCLHLVDRIERALKRYPHVRDVHVVGGVSANTHLRWLLGQRLGSITLRVPASLSFCTDNAAMIAAAAQFMVEELGDGAYQEFQTAASLSLSSAITKGHAAIGYSLSPRERWSESNGERR